MRSLLPQDDQVIANIAGSTDYSQRAVIALTSAGHSKILVTSLVSIHADRF